MKIVGTALRKTTDVCTQVFSKLESGRVPSVDEIVASVAAARGSTVQG